MELHSVSLAQILEAVFYFQRNRKLPNSAGTLDKGKKEQMLLKGFVV